MSFIHNKASIYSFSYIVTENIIIWMHRLTSECIQNYFKILVQNLYYFFSQIPVLPFSQVLINIRQYMPLGSAISNKALMDIHDVPVAVHRPTTMRFFHRSFVTKRVYCLIVWQICSVLSEKRLELHFKLLEFQ